MPGGPVALSPDDVEEESPTLNASDVEEAPPKQYLPEVNKALAAAPKPAVPAELQPSKSIFLSPQERTGTHMTAVPGSDSPEAQARRVEQAYATAGEYVPQAAMPALDVANRVAVQPFNRMAQAGGAGLARRAERATAAFVEPSIPNVGRAGATEEQKQAQVEQFRQEHPVAAAVARGTGETVGGMAADPRYWPFFASSLARPLLGRLISGAFTTQMSATTAEGAKQLYDNWDKMTPAQRAELGTQTGIGALFLAHGAVKTGGGAHGYEGPNLNTPEGKAELFGNLLYKYGAKIPENPTESQVHQQFRKAVANATTDPGSRGDVSGRGTDWQTITAFYGDLKQSGYFKGNAAPEPPAPTRAQLAEYLERAHGDPSIAKVMYTTDHSVEAARAEEATTEKPQKPAVTPEPSQPTQEVIPPSKPSTAVKEATKPPIVELKANEVEEEQPKGVESANAKNETATTLGGGATDQERGVSGSSTGRRRDVNAPTETDRPTGPTAPVSAGGQEQPTGPSSSGTGERNAGPGQLVKGDSVTLPDGRKGTVKYSSPSDMVPVVTVTVDGKTQRFIGKKDVAGLKRVETSALADNSTEISPKTLERRQDLAERRSEVAHPEEERRGPQRRVSEMTSSELRTAALEDYKSGGAFLNERAWNERERQPHMAITDVDGLGALNDQHGHEAGDAMIRAYGEAFRAAGLPAYRIGGDEVRAQGQMPEELRQKLEKAREDLRGRQIGFTHDGKEYTLSGVDFSYGIGHDEGTSDTALYAHKAEREASGERAHKGQLGRGVKVSERVDQQLAAPASGTTETEVEQPPKNNPTEALKAALHELNPHDTTTPSSNKVIFNASIYEHRGTQFFKDGKLLDKSDDIADAIDALEAPPGKVIEAKPAPAGQYRVDDIAPEPWQMTKAEWMAQRPAGTAPGMHSWAIDKALRRGDSVPDRVLKDYHNDSYIKDAIAASPQRKKEVEELKAKVASLEKGPAGAPGEEPAKQDRIVPGARSAATGNETGTTSIQDLTESIQRQAGQNSSVKTRINLGADLAEAREKAKDGVSSALARLKGGMAALWDAYARPPHWTDYEDATGKWSGADQANALDLERFTKALKTAVPDKARRVAISNWIEAGGDDAVLRERAEKSAAPWKAGYEAALTLTDAETTIARNVMNRNDATLAEAQKAGLLQQGVENYVRHVYADNPKMERRVMAEMNFNSLQTKPSFTKQRTLPTYFDAEQLGFKPKDKDVGFLTASHERAFREALAARDYIKALMEGEARDGRPLVITSWSSAKELPSAEGQKSAAYMVRPNIKPEEEYTDYRRIDHPALRGWRWAGKTSDGEPIFVQGDALVHPDIYNKLSNNLGRSALRTFQVDIGGHAFRPGNFALNVSSEIKHGILSFSGFHQTTLGIHAVEHRTLPVGMPELDLNVPDQKFLVDHGLNVAQYDAAEAFSEGVASGGLITKIPFIGPAYHAYIDYLFKDYLPRVKMAMALHALKRNTGFYGSKLSRDQVGALTAREANAAFGGLNYKMLGRNKTLQDVLRLGLMAPDFTEARARFAGQAAKPYGREQLYALLGGALVLYTLGRVFNEMLDNNPHWDKPFTLVYNGKEYNLRTVQGDIASALQKPGAYVRNRLSPLVNAGIQAMEGRDRFGHKQTLSRLAREMARNNVPIPAQPWTKESDDSWAQKAVSTILKMVGVNEARSLSDAMKKAAELRRDNPGDHERTPEQRAHWREIRKAIEQYHASSGQDYSAAVALAETGRLSDYERRELEAGMQMSPLAFEVRGLPAEDVLQVYEEATDQEKRELLQYHSGAFELLIEKHMEAAALADNNDKPELATTERKQGQRLIDEFQRLQSAEGATPVR